MMQRKTFYLPLVVLIAALTFASACGRKEPAPEAKRYPLRGKVLSVDAQKKLVSVDHEEIPGYMAAMTMSYRLKDNSDYARLQRGDRIEATLVVAGKDYWLEGLFITRPPEGSENLPEPPAPRALPKAGTAPPDVTLLTHEGKRVKLSALRGKIVVLTFIYTRCPLPDYCPRMNMNLANIGNAFESDPARATKLQLLSVSFDPEYDTPAVLRASREAYRPANLKKNVAWDFVTASKADV
ncbi:MAG TPA: SCO family protein, partial [Candidatus Nitrosotenuis sp.]|nr:SCO family protein [Candidatus Nitrosotenuis sp.]